MPRGRRATKKQEFSRIYLNPIVADIARLAAEKDGVSVGVMLDSLLRKRRDYAEIIAGAKKRMEEGLDGLQETSGDVADPGGLPVSDGSPTTIGRATTIEPQNVDIPGVLVDISTLAPSTELTPAARIFAQVLGAPPAKDAELLDQLLELAGSQKIFLAWVKAFAADGGKTPMEMLRGLHRWTK